jgi:hypothetical protein
MTMVIVLVNVAAACAFLFGATNDWAPLIRKSERANRLWGSAAAATLAFVLLAVIRGT